ncbi:hypothetical protein NDU88_007321 [Pleurodeles waltl]|uniref:Uncharacterized protein n=1 Tax=Pleurodeles waltl TaxID=8319 RepID=A0AAV7LZJ0_PLEWA|nr:hypothetical protein NDU88_007321 [Pleurodeles waltl]
MPGTKALYKRACRVRRPQVALFIAPRGPVVTKALYNRACVVRRPQVGAFEMTIRTPLVSAPPRVSINKALSCAQGQRVSPRTCRVAGSDGRRGGQQRPLGRCPVPGRSWGRRAVQGRRKSAFTTAHNLGATKMVS